jgi:hypothetical protein
MSLIKKYHLFILTIAMFFIGVTANEGCRTVFPGETPATTESSCSLGWQLSNAMIQGQEVVDRCNKVIKQIIENRGE